jgi:hypothetical protein
LPNPTWRPDVPEILCHLVWCGVSSSFLWLALSPTFVLFLFLVLWIHSIVKEWAHSTP